MTRPGRPIRVLFALPGLHRVDRGAEVAFESIAQRLHAGRRFDVTLIGSGRARADRAYAFRHAGCVARERFARWPKFPPLRHEYAWEEMTFAWGLARAYRADEFDVAVACSYPFTNWVLRAKRRFGTPRHVYVTQNGDWPLREHRREYRYFGCDALVCTNPEYFERHRRARPTALIPNGVDVERFHLNPVDRSRFGAPPDRPVVLLVGALIESKRVEEGVAAAASIPEAFVLVAGDGPLRARVVAAMERLAPGRSTRLTVPPEAMPDLYRAGDALLHMSLDEPFGNIYVEALAAGLPVVAHDTPSTRWITQDQATLVDTRDGAALAVALREALAGRAPGTAQSRRDLAASRYSWDAVASQYADFLERVHSPFTRPPSQRHEGARA